MGGVQMANPVKWKAVQTGNSWQVQTDGGVVIATIGNGKSAKANAKLIAVSPYLLQALKAMVELIGDEDLPDNGELSGAAICDMVRSAIELAE
jgi:hypothetical protein